jgi:hypothetical protein
MQLQSLGKRVGRLGCAAACRQRRCQGRPDWRTALHILIHLRPGFVDGCCIASLPLQSDQPSECILLHFAAFLI